MELSNLKSIVKGNTCFICAAGKSLNILENRIEEFKDLNVVWIGMNYFSLPEHFILTQINKEFNIVFDCASITNPEIYEPQHRVPLLDSYLSRKEKNLWITAYSLLKDMRKAGQNDFILKHKEKTLILDPILRNPDYPKEVLVRPPNSLSYLLSILVAGQAKKIVIFGFDGLLKDDKRTPEDNIKTYYKSDFVRKERILGCGWLHPGILAWDSEQFDERFPKILEIYKKIFNNHTVEIVNCSPKTIIKVLKKIDYNNVKQEVI